MRWRSNSIEALYNQIFEQVYPQIQDKRIGVLHKTIHLILKTEDLKTEEPEADVICKYFGIKDYDDFKNDYKILDTIIKNPQEYHELKLPIDLQLPIELPLPKLRIKQEIHEEKEMKNWIVVIACILVGVYACIKFLENKQKREGKEPSDDDRNPPRPENSAPFTPSKSIKVALCLVVPAYIASDVKGQPTIDSYAIEQLIDKASYFLSTQCDQADAIQTYLQFSREDILNIGEQREVYIRIDIPNGQEMIGKTSTYILKRNLPSNSQGVVRQIACLNNLSGLEKFNRV